MIKFETKSNNFGVKVIEKSRKDHKCIACSKIIPAGSSYHLLEEYSGTNPIPIRMSFCEKCSCFIPGGNIIPSIMKNILRLKKVIEFLRSISPSMFHEKNCKMEKCDSPWHNKSHSFHSRCSDCGGSTSDPKFVKVPSRTDERIEEILKGDYDGRPANPYA